MEVRMPNLSGIGCARRLKAELPELPVLILTASSDTADITESVAAGVSGYLIKPVRPEQLNEAVGEVLHGRVVLCAEAQTALAHHVRRLGIMRSADDLSRREREVMRFVVSDFTNKEIAQRLGISEGTVHSHLIRAFRKMGVRTREEARRKLLTGEK
jgi:DNA-binding NarL/FixJ family response regulator